MFYIKRCVCGQFHCPVCGNQMGEQKPNQCPVCQLQIEELEDIAKKIEENEPIDKSNLIKSNDY